MKRKYISLQELGEKVKNWDGKLYKVFKDGSFTPTHSGRCDWVPGEWTERIEDVKMCARGWHLTTHYAHWWEGGDVWLAESDSIVEFDGYDKVVCERVRLIERLETGGNYNSGSHNSGNHNSGSCNSGSHNSGKHNSGNWNSGNHNSGHYNSGHYNSGNHNSGYCNSGSRNSGNCNSGASNSGSYNAGDWNSGNWNTASGTWNHLCTKVVQRYLFNKPVEDFPEFPDWFNLDTGDGESLVSAWARSFSAADREGIIDAINLPNFDYEVFEEISGISREMIEERLADK